MAHDVHWMKPGRVLYVNYKGYQTEETLVACLDDMEAELDQVDTPVAILINWAEVEGMDLKALLNVRGHRTFSHPMAARGVLVGMDKRTRMENEISSVQTRQGKNTQYYETMEEALEYLKHMLEDLPSGDG
ncbi:MAG: hypothetical protein KJ064_08615 [Anaerolineae bacterium]|nr:hypothetical protein [Anaerolineae bacterium]